MSISGTSKCRLLVILPVLVSILLTIQAPLRAQEVIGRVVKVDRDDSGLPYTYYYIPSSAPKDVMRPLLFIAYSSPTVDSYEDTDEYARGRLDHFLRHDLAEASKLIMLTVAVPPLLREVPGTGIPCQLHRFNVQQYILNEPYCRPDLKFISVLNHFRKALTTAGFRVDPKFFMTGSSSGGVWTHRFALLHPELIKAAAPGGIGMYTMPLMVYDGRSMPYPIGISDLEALGLPSFNSPAFEEIPFFVFIGKDDTNAPLNEARDKPDPPENLTLEQVVWFLETFGETPQARAQSFHEQLLALGMDSTFKAYPGVGHEWTYNMKLDTINFFLRAIGSPSLANTEGTLGSAESEPGSIDCGVRTEIEWTKTEPLATDTRGDTQETNADIISLHCLVDGECLYARLAVAGSADSARTRVRFSLYLESSEWPVGTQYGLHSDDGSLHGPAGRLASILVEIGESVEFAVPLELVGYPSSVLVKAESRPTGGTWADRYDDTGWHYLVVGVTE